MVEETLLRRLIAEEIYKAQNPGLSGIFICSNCHRVEPMETVSRICPVCRTGLNMYGLDAQTLWNAYEAWLTAIHSKAVSNA